MAWQHVERTQDAGFALDEFACFEDSKVHGSIQVACGIEGSRAELEGSIDGACLYLQLE